MNYGIHNQTLTGTSYEATIGTKAENYLVHEIRFFWGDSLIHLPQYTATPCMQHVTCLFPTGAGGGLGAAAGGGGAGAESAEASAGRPTSSQQGHRKRTEK